MSCKHKARRACTAGAVALYCLTLASGPTTRADDAKPGVLLAAEAARAAALLRTGHVEYCRQTRDAQGGRRTNYYTWRCAGDTQIHVDNGDEHGVAMRDAEGRGRDDLTYPGPLHLLQKDGEVWYHAEDSPEASVFEGEQADFFRFDDMRRLGLDPVSGGDLAERARQLNYPPPDYYTNQEGELLVVTAAIESGQCRWWIDPRKDCNVVRTDVWLHGQEISETRYTLAQFDGVWFPEKIETFRRAAGDDREPSRVLTVLAAEFNQPTHPEELTPTDIGVESGVQISYKNRPGVSLMIWDGAKAVPPIEYFDRLKRGEVRRGPTVERELARDRAAEASPKRQPAAAPAASTQGSAASQPDATANADNQEDADYLWRFESIWAAYTRRFIIKNRLSTELARKAWQICRVCEKEGRSYVHSRRSEIAAVDKRAADGDHPRRLDAARLDERRRELTRPLARIFEKKLKPGLERLLRAPASSPSADGS